MKSVFVILSALAVFGAATPAPSEELIARGLALVERQQGCHQCIDNCQAVGGIADAACKIVICAVQVRVTPAGCLQYTNRFLSALSLILNKFKSFTHQQWMVKVARNLE